MTIDISAGVPRSRQRIRLPSPRGFLARPETRSRATLILMGLTLVVAIVADYLARWPYVMTPLYGIPVLIGAFRLTTVQVAVAGILVSALDVLSSFVQHTPPTVALLYAFGLAVTAGMAVLLAYYRGKSTRLAADAAQHARDAEQSRDRIELFMRMIAHDLRNPLTVSAGYIRMLRHQIGQLDPERAREALGELAQATNRLERLTSDLVDTGELSTGRFAVQPKPLDLVSVIQHVCDLRAPAAGSPPLVVRAPERLEGCWDRDRVEQVVGNLVSNAVKYGEGSAVSITLEAAHDEALLTVADQGPGIPDDQIPSLFQPFVRLSRDARVEGSGLGLYIARGIVEAHGGRIWVESDAGVGTAFHVALPVAGRPTLPHRE